MTGARRSRRTGQAPAVCPERRELVIRAVGAQGDGEAAGVHIAFTLPGERLIAEIEGRRGQIVDLIDSSPDRVTPPCPHFGECGGCALQHWSFDAYLAWKVDRIREALARERLEVAILPPVLAPPGARRRIALHARKSANDVVVGFKTRRSWRVTQISSCEVAHPELVSALPTLANLATLLFEHPLSAPTLHVTHTLTGLDVDITGVESRSGGLSADARRRIAEIAGQADFARVTLVGEILFQARQPIVQVGGVLLDLPPGAFLQAVVAAEAAMTGFACEAAAGAKRIADLFCGVGAFSFPLARIAPVLAADAFAPAIRALSRATGAAPGLKSITAVHRDLDRRPITAEELAGFDVALFDPPRAGAEFQALEIARSKCQRVIGVSCNPTTFARDARILANAGLRLLQVLPVDQFLWSPHVELVGQFSRENGRP